MRQDSLTCIHERALSWKLVQCENFSNIENACLTVCRTWADNFEVAELTRDPVLIINPSLKKLWIILSISERFLNFQFKKFFQTLNFILTPMERKKISNSTIIISDQRHLITLPKLQRSKLSKMEVKNF